MSQARDRTRLNRIDSKTQRHRDTIPNDSPGQSRRQGAEPSENRHPSRGLTWMPCPFPCQTPSNRPCSTPVDNLRTRCRRKVRSRDNRPGKPKVWHLCHPRTRIVSGPIRAGAAPRLPRPQEYRQERISLSCPSLQAYCCCHTQNSHGSAVGPSSPSLQSSNFGIWVIAAVSS